MSGQRKMQCIVAGSAQQFHDDIYSRNTGVSRTVGNVPPSHGMSPANFSTPATPQNKQQGSRSTAKATVGDDADKDVIPHQKTTTEQDPEVARLFGSSQKKLTAHADPFATAPSQPQSHQYGRYSQAGQDAFAHYYRQKQHQHQHKPH